MKLPPSPFPTMRQLAEWAGVSTATVSLALRDHPALPQATRDRIQKLAKAKGYKSDPVVAKLMVQLRKTRTRRAEEKLALFSPFLSRSDQLKHEKGNRNYLDYRAGIQERAAKLGYEIEEFWVKEPGLTCSRLSKILYTRGIRGLILAPFIRPRGHLSLQWEHFSAVALGHTLVKPDLHRVSHSHYNGMLLALRRLKQLGYKRPGFATQASQNDRVNRQWLASFLAYQFSLPAKSRIPPLLAEDLGLKNFRAWIEKYQPDVVLSNMIRPLRMLASMGWAVPKQIGFVSLDRSAIQPDGLPMPSGVDQQAFQQGAVAADTVIKQVEKNEFGLPAHPVSLHLEGLWQDGATLQARR